MKKTLRARTINKKRPLSFLDWDIRFTTDIFHFQTGIFDSQRTSFISRLGYSIHNGHLSFLDWDIRFTTNTLKFVFKTKNEKDFFLSCKVSLLHKTTIKDNQFSAIKTTKSHSSMTIQRLNGCELLCHFINLSAHKRTSTQSL